MVTRGSHSTNAPPPSNLKIYTSPRRGIDGISLTAHHPFFCLQVALYDAIRLSEHQNFKYLHARGQFSIDTIALNSDLY